MTTRRLFTALFLVALFAMGVRDTLDPDMWWHLRTGEHILQAGIPRHDIFSFTVSDHEWVTHEWLSQVVMWLVYTVAGLPGLMVVFAALIMAAFALVYGATPGRPYLAGFVVLLAAIASAIVWGPRPQIFNILFTAAFVFVVEGVKNGRFRDRMFWLLPALMVVWANLHSGYLLGVVLLATYVVGEAGQRWLWWPAARTLSWPSLRRLVLATGLSFLVAAINPNGPELWLYPFFTLGSNAMQTHIQEWRSPDFHRAIFMPFAALLAVGAMSWALSRKRPTLTELLLFLGTGAAGLLSARHIPIFAVVAPPIVARYLLATVGGTAVYPLLSGHGHQEAPSRFFRRLNLFLLAMSVVAAAGWMVVKMGKNEEAIDDAYPVAAVDYLEQTGLAQQRGYNSYNWGGYLIWRRVPVFVDGRADVYGDDFLFFYLNAYQVKPDWQQPLNDYDVAYVLMERNSALSNVLLASDHWRLDYQDDVAQIFVRTEES